MATFLMIIVGVAGVLISGYWALGEALCESGDCTERPDALVGGLFYGGLALVVLGIARVLWAIWKRYFTYDR